VRPPEENLKRKEMLEAAEALKAKTYPSAIMVMSRTYITRGYTVSPFHVHSYQLLCCLNIVLHKRKGLMILK